MVTFCSRTKPLVDAAEDLSALGEGLIPIEENPMPSSQPISPLSPLIVGGKLTPPTCMLPLAIISMLGLLPMRTIRKGRSGE